MATWYKTWIPKREEWKYWVKSQSNPRCGWGFYYRLLLWIGIYCGWEAFIIITQTTGSGGTPCKRSFRQLPWFLLHCVWIPTVKNIPSYVSFSECFPPFLQKCSQWPTTVSLATCGTHYIFLYKPWIWREDCSHPLCVGMTKHGLAFICQAELPAFQV